MPRLLGRGAGVASPNKGEEEFRKVLSDLHADQLLNCDAAHSLYWNLGAIIGKWMSALEDRMEASPIAKALLSTSRNLSEVSRLLSGRETGFRTGIEISVTNETVRYLAQDPSLGPTTSAPEFVSAFARDAARLAHVCMVAYEALPDRSADGGRPALDWSVAGGDHLQRSDRAMLRRASDSAPALLEGTGRHAESPRRASGSRLSLSARPVS
jgi:hypothetical protein